jgi:DNA-binding NarL/FixJ family response regulator
VVLVLSEVTVAVHKVPVVAEPLCLRILVVDDQELIRSGFSLLLDGYADLEVVGTASDGAEAVRAAAELRPDVVLMDVRMPVLDGIQATQRIVADRPETKVLVLTTFDLDEHVYDALRAGASGFLLKDVPAAELAQGIRTVARGDLLLAPAVTRRLVEKVDIRSRPHPAAAQLAHLTDKEREVLSLVAKGLSNAEIGERMYISEATVKTHVGHCLQKLDQRDRVQLVVLAYEAGIVKAGEA